jgi:hypothetical protein
VGVVLEGADGTLILLGGGTIAGVAGLGELGVGVGTAVGAAVGNAIENIGNLFNPSLSSSQTASAVPSEVNNASFPPGSWPGDKGGCRVGENEKELAQMREEDGFIAPSKNVQGTKPLINSVLILTLEIQLTASKRRHAGG